MSFEGDMHPSETPESTGDKSRNKRNNRKSRQRDQQNGPRQSGRHHGRNDKGNNRRSTEKPNRDQDHKSGRGRRDDSDHASREDSDNSRNRNKQNERSGNARREHRNKAYNQRPRRSPYRNVANNSSQQSSRFNRGIYSAIDLGTNNCRLLIARPTRQGFRVVDAFSRIVRLGEGVSVNGVMSDDAMDRTVEALKVCAEKIKRRGVTCMRHVATEACRVAGNTEAFVDRVRSETGINLEVISAGEEARLAVMGCQSLLAPGNKHALVFDIGGGSTELIWVKILPGKGTEMQGWMSIPWGVVNLTERFESIANNDPLGAYSAMRQEVDKHLQAFEDAHLLSNQIGRKRVQFLGTSGTVTTLASLHLNLPRYVRDKVDGAWMKTPDIQRLSRQVAEMSHIERAAQPCIGAERADLVVAGCAILEAILGKWSVPSLRVADRGIREGILRGLMEMERPPRLASHIARQMGETEEQAHRQNKERAGEARSKNANRNNSRRGGKNRRRNRHG